MMQTPDKQSETQTETPKPSHSFKRRWAMRFLKFSGLCFLLLFCVSFWILQTSSGTRWALQSLPTLLGIDVRLSEVDGRLADHLSINELQYRDASEHITLSGIELDWNPWALSRGRLEISKVQASRLKIAGKPSTKPVHAPTSLELPVDVKITQAALGQLHLAEWGQDGSEKTFFSLRALSASNVTASAREARYQLQASATSEWGQFDLEGKLGMRSPFALEAHGSYKGQAHPEVPAVTASMQFSGSLLDLHAQALVQQLEQLASQQPLQQREQGAQVAANRQPTVSKPSASKNSANISTQGEVEVRVHSFATHPLRMAKVSVKALNLNQLNPHAPLAVLDIQANLEAQSNAQVAHAEAGKVGKPGEANKISSQKLKPQEPTREPVASDYALNGHIAVQNAKPQSFDQHGIPFRAASAALEWRKDLISLKDFKLEMLTGTFLGHANLSLREHALPTLDASLRAENIDLLLFDSRLRRTQIKGDLQIQTKRVGFIDFQVQANDARHRLDGRANFEFNQAGDNGTLHVEKLDFQTDQSRFQGSGDISFEAAQKFSLQGGLSQFDPSLWSSLPKGRINSDLKLSGSLHPKINLQAQLSQLTGEWDGSKLDGNSKFAWIEDQSLSLEQLDLTWGKNSLSASGAIGKSNEELRWSLKANDLRVFANAVGVPMAGQLSGDGKFGGSFDALTMQAETKLESFSMKQWRLNQGELKLRAAPGAQGALDISLQAKGLASASIDLNATGSDGQIVEKKRTWAEELSFQLRGNKQAHQLQLRTQFDKSHRTELLGEGAVDLGSWKTANWKGQFSQFKLVGFANSGSLTKRQELNDLQLDMPMNVELARERVYLGSGQFSGIIGKLKLDQFEWTPVSMQTKGSLDELRVVDVVNLWKAQQYVSGDLKLAANWDLQLKGSAKGNIEIRRQAGDLLLNDGDGTGQVMSMGLNDLRLSAKAGGLIAGSDAEKLSFDFNADGKRLGQWRAKLATELRQRGEKWLLESDAPVSGEVHATLPELQWLAAQLSAEFGLKGSLSLDAQVAGVMGKPTYHANIVGKGLELAVASEGLLFPNGELSAELTEKSVKLQQLRFHNKINFIPKIEQTRELNWIGQEGEFVASGEIKWRENSGAIDMQWKKFPALQRKDRWLVMSGNAQITQKDNAWSLTGKLGADGAYLKLPKLPPPSLSNDVIINQALKLDPEDTELDERKGFKAQVDLQIDMGPRFVFVGRGLNTALTGTMRMRLSDKGNFQASGSIATNGGQYEGYGQQLEIERGILKFQGAPNNPSLNVRALRKGLLVEAGVEVTGNVANPQVRLVSEPNVPDNDKISWLILGREADQLGVNDASLLLTAAGALFGSDGSGNIPKELAKGLGFDEFSIGPAENGGSSKLPSQTIAGETTVGAGNNDNVLNIGWRIKPGLVLSIERGLSDASSALKASWQLGRRVRLVARSGTDLSLDVKYSFSFN